MIIKKFRLLVFYFVVLFLFTVYVVLDTLVFSSFYEVVNNNIGKNIDTGDISSSDTKYVDDNIKIEIKEYRENNTTIYVADVEVMEKMLLKRHLLLLKMLMQYLQ